MKTVDMTAPTPEKFSSQAAPDVLVALRQIAERPAAYPALRAVLGH
jgi:hypothetical protein